VCADSEFHDLREDWNNVLKKCKDNNVFLTWEWLSTWWKHYGTGRKLLILLAENENKIVSIAPLMNSVDKLLGFKLRKIEFLGSKHTDYHNFLLAKQKEKSLKLFLSYLNKISWDCMELKEIPETAESIFLLRKLHSQNFMFSEEVSGQCPYINLPKSWETFYKELRGNKRSTLGRCLRALSKRYEVKFSKHSNIESLPEAMKTFCILHEKRWRSKGLPGSFQEDPKFRNFLLDISQLFAKKDWLNLSFLTVNDEPISSVLCFEYNETLYGYHGGFDPNYSKFSVGNLLIMFLIKDAIRRGLTKFDFLKGAETYKYTWNALVRNNIEARCIKNRFLPIIYDRMKRTDNVFFTKVRKYGRRISRRFEES